ncbi:carboxylesterase/lipase family protein [Sphingosinicella terrae]|uniref:carboxylesterase/lipase family protein n=1 Tax=Sphingosinicella terrae TaxID=2172047 RepID=UPI000E0D7034|nr:carboxylesterase/lipase family protein [Sphingosinicella terrae]
MTSISRRAMLAGSAAVAAFPAAARARREVPVESPAGRFAGIREQGIRRFLGIRYGRARRFEAPAAEPAAREVVDAAAFGPACPQRGDRYQPQDEDCLTLNIWSPEADARARRPVMVYFHGGAYSAGSVADPLNDGRHLAARGDVVVVTVNHRLNAFGYLYLARLDPRFPDSGNAGQLDLVLALRWIRDNIADFGGDPGRVMVFGQSGGGAKIATLMGMPAAAGLFHRAATMSGQQVTASGPLNATARTSAYMAALGARSADELLAMPTPALVEGLSATDPILGGGVYFGPVLDMKWLARHPFWPDAPPQSNPIPMMLGNTRDETRGFFGPDHPRIVGLDWSNLAERMAPELRVDAHPEWVVAEYRKLFPGFSAEEVFFAATTAGRSWRGQVEEADARARAGAPTWVYQLDFPSPIEPWRGAPHTLDIPLVFGTLDAAGSIAGTGADSRRLSAAMMDAFIALARNGDPNHADLPDWPVHRVPERQTMVFDRRLRVENDPRRVQRELFARVPYVQPGT